MNPEREFPVQERIYGILVNVQLFIERFLPKKKRGRILSVHELEEIMSKDFSENFFNSFMNHHNG